MRFATIALAGTGLLLWVGASGGRCGDEASLDPDEVLLHECKVGTDGASLLAYLNENTGSDDDLLNIDRLVRQLGADTFEEREEASAKLVKLRAAALPALAKARRSDDPEVKRRANEAVERIGRDYHMGLALAVVRRLVQNPPDDAVKTLVRYLPSAGDEAVEEEIYFGIYAVTAKAKSVDAALAAALTDKVPARRALAACIIGRLGDAEHRAAVRKLFADPDPVVRLRAAQGLLAAKDKEAIPVLIALLEAERISVAWQAEELLHWAAGETAPKELVGAGGATAKRVCRKAWEAWWSKGGESLKLDSADAQLGRPGLLLACLQYVRGGDGVVALYGCDGKVRWALPDMRQPYDARLLADDRVMVAEWDANQVAEWTPDGKRMWNREVVRPQACERLPNGDTFIAHTKASLIGADGTEIYSRSLPRHIAGQNLILCCFQPLCAGAVVGIDDTVSPSGAMALFDLSTGKEIRTLRPPGVGRTDSVEGLAGGGLLFCRHDVYETNAAGQLIRTFSVEANHAVRLPNGDTLVCRWTKDYQGFVEVNPEGKAVWEALVDGTPWRARDCLSLVRLGFDAPRLEAPDRSSMAALLEELSGSAPERRLRALRLLRPAGDAPPELVAALIQLLSDPDDQMSREATDMLGGMSPRRTMAAVLPLLHDKGCAVRAEAVQILGRWREHAREAYAEILALQHDECARVRNAVVLALSVINPDGKEVMPLLLDGMADENREVQLSAVMRLMERGEGGAAATPALLKLLSGKDITLRVEAAVALTHVAPTDEVVIKALLDICKDPMELFVMRATAASALAEVQPPPPGAVEAVGRVLLAAGAMEDAGTRESIQLDLLSTLRRLGSHAAPAIPSLVELVKDAKADKASRAQAIQVLGGMGPAAKESVPALTDALQDKELVIQLLADMALKQIKR